MPISPRLDFRRCLEVDSTTNRTAVYGPVRTVVWEGRRSCQVCTDTTNTRLCGRPRLARAVVEHVANAELHLHVSRQAAADGSEVHQIDRRHAAFRDLVRGI